MATAQYQCKIIGDGKSPETAFRPAIEDVLVPVLGTKAFPTWRIVGEIPVDKNGFPTITQVVIEVADDTRAALVAGNPDIAVVSVLEIA